MVTILGMASNRGRNLLNLHRQRPGGASIGVVLSNHADAPVLESAAEHDIPTVALERDPGEGRIAHEKRILAAIAEFEVDLVCLDGYMRVLSDVFLRAMPPTLNVHPSLLPAFPGMDAWGDALDAGVSVSGCTVHVVTDATDEAGRIIEEDVDAGPIVTQQPVGVRPDDDRESLTERILYQGEFTAYPRAVRWIAEGVVTIEDANGSPSLRVTDGGDVPFPRVRVGAESRIDVLRYGENPHQEAALYTDVPVDEPSVVQGAQVGGDRGMSYVNYVDAAGALDLIMEFDRPAAAVIKHANPAGCAVADRLPTAYDRALSTDPMSAFGGVVALNRPCDRETATAIVDSVKHVVVAPGCETGVLEILGERESMRVIDVSGDDPRSIGPADRTAPTAERRLVGGRLVQDRDRHRLSRDDLEVVTERAPSDAEVESMLFAWRVVKHATSNAIAFATETETVGMGIGQVSRVDAVRLAAMKAAEHATGKGPEDAVMASDAFFPFPDGIEMAADAGVAAVIQPGGSMRDDAVIAAADEHDMAMAFTGTRCFRHD